MLLLFYSGAEAAAAVAVVCEAFCGYLLNPRKRQRIAPWRRHSLSFPSDSSVVDSSVLAFFLSWWVRRFGTAEASSWLRSVRIASYVKPLGE